MDHLISIFSVRQSNIYCQLKCNIAFHVCQTSILSQPLLQKILGLAVEREAMSPKLSAKNEV